MIDRTQEDINQDVRIAHVEEQLKVALAMLDKLQDAVDKLRPLTVRLDSLEDVAHDITKAIAAVMEGVNHLIQSRLGL